MQETTKSLRPSPTALLNPRCDAIFKTLFTDNSDEGRLALRSFLEAVLEAKVSNVKLIPNETAVESETDKQAVFDVTCTLDEKEAVNIEMQGIDVSKSYDKRAEYNVAHLLNHFTPKGTKWKDIPKVFQISVLNFVYDPSTKEPFSVYKMKTEDNHHLSDRMSIIFIELPKLISEDEEDIKNLTPAEKWGKFLLYADDEERRNYVSRLCSSEDGIMAAQAVLSKISQDDINWVTQNSKYKGYIDYISSMSEAKEEGYELGHELGFKVGLEDGMKQGIEQGIEQGREQGLAQGREEGITQGRAENQIAVAKNALKMNLSSEQISELTGLSIEEIERLK